MALRWIAGILACLMIAASTTWIQKYQLAERDTGLDEELLYLPNERLLTHFTAGLSGVLADLLWIRTIGYAADEFKSQEKKFTWLEHMVRTVTRLDPYYEDAYANGGMLLSALGQDDRSLPLLREGLVRVPESTKIPNEIVNIYLLNKRHAPEAPAITLLYLKILADNSRFPDFYMAWMDRIRATNSLEGEARRVWQDLAESSPDEFVRELARSQLIALDAESALNNLNAAADDFRQVRGQEPQSIEDLFDFAGDKLERPAEKLGDFYFGPDGLVRSSVLDARAVDRSKRALLGGIKNYQEKNGSLPPTLEALKEINKLIKPEHPVPGYEWRYDPATGDIAEVPSDING